MLTIEQQKRLTEFGGWCWHEQGPETVMSFHPYLCRKCNTPLHVDEKHNKPDFSDWRVVGRLIEKINATLPDQFPYDKAEAALWKDNPRKALCKVIDSYLKEREGK